jgi:hypothetical protein
MNYRMIALRCAALLTGGLVAGLAQAAPLKVDVGNDSITCSTVVGATVSISPPLSFAGAANRATIRVKGKLAGCVDTTNPSVLIASGSFSGTLTGETNNCSALSGTQPVHGTIVYSWKADPTTPLLQTSSVQTVNGITGQLFHPSPSDPAFAGAAYGSFALGTASVTGAFTGGDGGVTSTSIAVTSEDIGLFNTLCAPPAAGIKTLHIGIAKLTLS